VNRTDRLYALIEELRAISPRYVEASALASRFGVAGRTIARDLARLRASGLPIEGTPATGYRLDLAQAHPPLSLTPAEAAVVAMALDRIGDTPYATEAAAVLTKLTAALSPQPPPEPSPDPPPGPSAGRRPGEPPEEPVAGPADVSRGDDSLADDVPEDDGSEDDGWSPVGRTIQRALLRREALRIEYADHRGALTARDVEPRVFLGGRGGIWYLVAWCRLREDIRVFRLDRIATAHPLTPPPEPPEPPGPSEPRGPSEPHGPGEPPETVGGRA
jgi:predicted DNA-binding transcriptional regulator YafY